MKQYISFGTLSLVLIFPFAMPIFYCMRSYFENVRPIIIELNIADREILHPFFISFLIVISNFIMGIPLGINKLLNMNKKKEMVEETQLSIAKNGNLLMSKVFHKKNMKQNTLSILLIFFCALAVSCILIFSVILNSSQQNILIGFQMNIALLLYDGIFSRLFLRYSIYRHQLLSICICIVGIALVCYNTFSNIVLSVYFLILYLFISLINITEKYLMEKLYFNPSHLIFYIGCVQMILFTIIFTITSLVNCPLSWNGVYCKSGKTIEPIFLLLRDIIVDNPIVILNMLIPIVVGLVYLIFFFLTLFYFSPCHRSMSDILSSFIIWVINTKWNLQSLEQILIPLLGYLLILFASFVFNELIVLHCFGLNEFTKKEINERGRRESLNGDKFMIEIKTIGIDEI